MNKKIKVIDIFKRIEKHEDIPQNIKYKDNCYTFKHTNYSIDHLYELIGHECIGWLEHKDINLFDEIEILEDNIEEIEELKYDVVDENGRGWYKLDTIADKVTELIKSVNAIREKPYEAIQVILNELDKKDKVIDMMANELRDTCHFEYMSRKEVKEYFYNKIEIPEEN